MGAVATLLSSHAGDPGRRWATQRPRSDTFADKQTKSQPTAGPDLNRPAGRQSKQPKHGSQQAESDTTLSASLDAPASGVGAASHSEQTRCTAVRAMWPRCLRFLAGLGISRSLGVVLTASSIRAAKGAGMPATWSPRRLSRNAATLPVSRRRADAGSRSLAGRA